MLIVALNFFTVLFGFTAVLAMTASRMSKRHNDWACLCCFAEFTKAKKTKSERHNAAHVFDPFFDFMTNDWTRIVGFIGFWALVGLGIYGSTMAKLGLPIADIVPDGTYASDFLTVRQEFFFSYLISLYSDASGSDLKRMNWPEKFETYINLTEDIYSLSDLVYSDPDVQDFWGWNMRDYLEENYEDAFDPYELGEYEEDDDDTIKTPDCDGDRWEKCPSLFANFSYTSPLYECLFYNYDNLASGCQNYIDSITPTNTTDTIAKQIQLIVAGDSDVEGLYVEASTSYVNVYSKYDGNGLIFQLSDYSWAVLDSDYDAVYFGPITANASQPPQFGWSYSDGGVAPVTIVYWDSDLLDAFRSGSIFIDDDVSSTDTFTFDYSFVANDENEGSCYLLEALKSLMSTTESFSSVQFNSTFGEGVACNAIFESTTICNSIASGERLGSTVCGAEAERAVRSISDTTFWTGNCNDTGFTIVGVNGIINITGSDGCGCDDGSFSTSLDYNFLSACGGSQFGGFDLSNGEGTCSNNNQDISLTCYADSCDSQDACIYDYVELSRNANNSLCDAGDLDLYLGGSFDFAMIPCLFWFYDDLSECCQLGLQEDYILNEQISCARLGSTDSRADICDIRETCTADCDDYCYYDTNGNCAESIVKYDCFDFYEDNNNTLLIDCLVNGNFYTKSFLGQCCYNQLASGWDEDCAIAQSYYWDVDGAVWNYTPDLCSSDDIDDLGCSSYDDNSVEQMDCMINNSYLLDNETCCYKAVSQSTTNYYFTHDCQGDTQDTFLWGENTWDLPNDRLETLAGFANQADLPDDPNDVSPTCTRSLQVCYSDGTWPVTAAGETAEIYCEDGYSGTRTRTCDDGTSNVPTWGDANETLCELTYCANETKRGQYFEETEVYHMRYYFGLPPSVEDNRLKVKCVLEHGQTYPYVQRYCHFNTTSRQAFWGESQPSCRGYFGQWDSTETVANGYCDPDDIDTNLVDIYDPTEDYDFEAAQLAACQDACDFTSHCAGIQWNNSTRKCKIYDACFPLEYSSSELEALNVTAGQITYFHAPLSLNQYGAGVCQGVVLSANITESDDFVPRDAWSRVGIPFPECFNVTLYLYFVNPAGGTLYRDKILFNNIDYLYDDDEGYRFNDLAVVSTFNSFAVNGIDDDTVAVKLIVDLRERLDEWEAEGLYFIPGGLVINLFSQYVGVEEALLTNLLWVSIAVMITGFTFLLNWWAVIICLLCNAAMIVEVYGFVEWLGLRVNGVLVLNIVIAVGLTMEFTAHIGRAFVLTKATPLDHERGVGLPFSTNGQIRMKKMYREMFNPVTMGAITTFLGVLPISLAEFPYFRQYYFVLYVVIVLFGWLNGVIFQPIFLSILQPAPFDEEPIPESVRPLTQNTETASGTAPNAENQNETGGANTNGTADDQKTAEE